MHNSCTYRIDARFLNGWFLFNTEKIFGNKLSQDAYIIGHIPVNIKIPLIRINLDSIVSTNLLIENDMCASKPKYSLSENNFTAMYTKSY